MKKLAPILIFGAFLLWVAASALRPPPRPDGFDVAALGRLPVVASGRVQPFDSVARNALLQIRSTAAVPLDESARRTTGRGTRTLGATEWLLEVLIRPDVADQRKIFLIHHPELLGELELEAQAGSGLSYYSFHDLGSKLEDIERQKLRIDQIEAGKRSAADRQLVKLFNAVLVYQQLKNSLQPNSALQREPGGVAFPFNLAARIARLEVELPAGAAAFAAMQDGAAFDRAAMTPVLRFLQPFQLVAQVALPRLVPPTDPEADRDRWEDVGSSLLGSLETRRVHPAVAYWAVISTAYEQGRSADFNRVVASYGGWLSAEGFEPELRKARREQFFNRFSPFIKATAIYVVTFLFTCAFWLGRSTTLYRSAALLAGLAFALHTAGLLFRMILEGRPPVTNLYSSAIFVGWGAVVLGLVIERFYRNGFGLATASFVGLVTQIIAHNLALSGDTMQMMQAVLDNNFWLATHVVVITLGYSSMFVAGFLAAGYVLAGVATPWLSTKAAASLERMVYGILCFATLFSFVGTMLGGIWADQSWGRFWGWDPKENGALMIVLWAAIYLHARWGRLVGKPVQMGLAVGGNIVTAFSWFGVNMLGVGLHSYGFMDSALTWLVGFVASQVAIVGLSLVPQRHWRSFRATSTVTSVPRRVPALAGRLDLVSGSCAAEPARSSDPLRVGEAKHAARRPGRRNQAHARGNA